MKAKCDSRPPLKPQLTIELSKAVDGSVVLRCLRSDQSVTWHKHKSQYARFFPLHDLTHFAVESALDLSRGFYGLIAAGWDIADTTGKGSRGALPEEALWVEHLVGMLDAERAGGVLSGAEE